jgi:hypothetical protein
MALSEVGRDVLDDYIIIQQVIEFLQFGLEVRIQLGAPTRRVLRAGSDRRA